jgi:hypothetical protein
MYQVVLKGTQVVLIRNTSGPDKEYLERCAERGEYLLYYHAAEVFSTPLFRRWEFRGLRSATQGSALRTRDLLKKVDQNFSADSVLCRFILPEELYR